MIAPLRLEALPANSGIITLREAIEDSPVHAVELIRPALPELPYRSLIDDLARGRGFRFDFNRLEPLEALISVTETLFRRGRFELECHAMAQDIHTLAGTISALTQTRPTISLRTYFAPGDLVWHVDRVDEADAYRLVWPIGRPAGMLLTPENNVDPAIYHGYMRREHTLLGRLDTNVLKSGRPVEELWAHRPAQLDALQTGNFPFVHNPANVTQVNTGAASIHRVQTPRHAGSIHRSSWQNRHTPGVQIVITAAA